MLSSYLNAKLYVKSSVFILKHLRLAGSISLGYLTVLNQIEVLRHKLDRNPSADRVTYALPSLTNDGCSFISSFPVCLYDEIH